MHSIPHLRSCHYDNFKGGDPVLPKCYQSLPQTVRETINLMIVDFLIQGVGQQTLGD